MPNWVKNRVRAKNRADAQKLIEILTKDAEGGRLTNFNGVLPMPDELRKTTADFHMKTDRDRELIKKYGYHNWYNFACAVWGTKWDNCKVHICANGEIEFETAWSIPRGVYEEISKTVPLVVAYADDDIGVNYGIVEFENGDCEEIDIGPNFTNYQIANAVWGNRFEHEDPEWAVKEHFSEEAQNAVDDIMSHGITNE